jgi:hypothetical protein
LDITQNMPCHPAYQEMALLWASVRCDRDTQVTKVKLSQVMSLSCVYSLPEACLPTTLPLYFSSLICSVRKYIHNLPSVHYLTVITQINTRIRICILLKLAIFDLLYISVLKLQEHTKGEPGGWYNKYLNHWIATVLITKLKNVREIINV